MNRKDAKGAKKEGRKYDMNEQNFQTQAHNDSVIFAIFICILTLVFFFQTSEQFLHWFVIPVTLCGILICVDAIEWFRGRLDIFSPIGVLGLLGFHFFFLAPLLHVGWDKWLDGITPPNDWRPWLGGMAILNFLGLLMYRFSREIYLKPAKRQLTQTVWVINKQHFAVVLSFALTLCGVLQLLVYKQYGGLSGYINAFTDAESQAGVGQGWLLMICESFPIIAMMGFTIYARNKKNLQNWRVLLIVLIVFFGLKLLFGGLRGSRSNTVWALLWAVGMIHLWIRPISKKQISIVLVFVFLFMFFYGFLKSGGIEGLQVAFQGQEARQEYIQEKGRTWDNVILGDLGRSDLHAFMLYRIMRHDSDYKLVWGRTYFAALSILIPKPLWPFPEKPLNKSKEGTDLQYGMDSYAPVDFVSSKVYGLAGETMLNFGPFAIPFAFILFGIVVGHIERWFQTLSAVDTRLLMLPMLANFNFVVLVGDLDNIIYFLVTVGAVPFLVLLLSSKKRIMNDE